MLVGSVSLNTISLGLLITFRTLCVRRDIALTTRHLRVKRPTVDTTLNQLQSLLTSSLFIQINQSVGPATETITVTPRIATTLSAVQTALTSLRAFSPTSSRGAFAVTASSCFTDVVLPTLLNVLDRRTPRMGLQLLPMRGSSLMGTVTGSAFSLTMKAFTSLPSCVLRRALLSRQFSNVTHDKRPTVGGKIVGLSSFVHFPRTLFALHQSSVNVVSRTLTGHSLGQHVTLAIPC